LPVTSFFDRTQRRKNNILQLNTQRLTARNTETVLYEIHRSTIVISTYSEQPDAIRSHKQYYHPHTQFFDASTILQEQMEV
jgi:hypothetical protein